MERLDIFMARANAAYYATHDPYADFTTAPEITQVFGELLGAWAAVQWQAMGAPDPVLLIEAGPGRGTLMADALRAAAVLPRFRAALRVHFVETSPRLRTLQAAAVPDSVWHDTLATVPDGPAIILANEFLDALPIRQFVARAGAWAERYVQDGIFVEQPRTAIRAVPVEAPLANVFFGRLDANGCGTEGVIHEVNEPACAFVYAVARRMAAQGGAALILDYGPARSGPGDSLQALREGRPADPLAEPGAADLTAHVDFATLASVARQAGAAVYGPRAQGPVLADLGLFQRTGRLAQTQAPARAAALVQAAQRLAEPDRMGRLFQVLAIQHPALPPPPGFAA